MPYVKAFNFLKQNKTGYFERIDNVSGRRRFTQSTPLPTTSPVHVKSAPPPSPSPSTLNHMVFPLST